MKRVEFSDCRLKIKRSDNSGDDWCLPTRGEDVVQTRLDHLNHIKYIFYFSSKTSKNTEMASLECYI